MDLRSLWNHSTALAWVGLRSFIFTIVLFAVLGLVLAVLVFWAFTGNALYAWVGALLALLETLIVGLFLGTKRAWIMALAEGFARLKLGAAAVRVCFNHLLQVSPEGGQFKERGTQMARAVEKLPLAEAERRLQKVVDDLINAPPEGKGFFGWFRRKLHKQLLRLVQACTLARFREQGTKEGGVDLLKAQPELEAGIDALLIARIKQGVNLWLFLVLIGMPLLVWGQLYLVLKFFPPG